MPYQHKSITNNPNVKVVMEYNYIDHYIYLIPLSVPACITQTHLNANFWEVDFHSQLFSTVHIRVVGFLKSTLQLM